VGVLGGEDPAAENRHPEGGEVAGAHVVAQAEELVVGAAARAVGELEIEAVEKDPSAWPARTSPSR